jgi:hypothetical protein
MHVVLTRRGTDAECAANRALIDLNRAIAPAAGFARAPTWRARQVGVLGFGVLGFRRRAAGQWSIGDGDDGLGGVREPRRPIPPLGSASLALDPPA